MAWANNWSTTGTESKPGGVGSCTGDHTKSLPVTSRRVYQLVPSNTHSTCDNLYEIMSTLVERGDTIKAIETSLEEKGRIEREDAMEKKHL